MSEHRHERKLKFHMHGYLIEFDKKSHRWTWNKWETTHNPGGPQRVVRHSGGLEFMKMFPSLVNGNPKSNFNRVTDKKKH